jgi:hypothetical protein
LDQHSRRVIGWAVSNRMKRDLAIWALNVTIAFTTPSKGCIHHSDRGSQGRFNRSSHHPAVEAGVSALVGTLWFRSSCGMPLTRMSPSSPLLKSRNLSFAEREETTLECARGTGVCAIARKLGRPPSTISRKIRRDSATHKCALWVLMKKVPK